MHTLYANKPMPDLIWLAGEVKKCRNLSNEILKVCEGIHKFPANLIKATIVNYLIEIKHYMKRFKLKDVEVVNLKEESGFGKPQADFY